MPEAGRDEVGGEKGELLKGRRVEGETMVSLAARSKGRRGKRERDVREAETNALLHADSDPPCCNATSYRRRMCSHAQVSSN